MWYRNRFQVQEYGQNVSVLYYTHQVHPEMGRRFRPSVIVCAGGAYAMRSSTEEEGVAIQYQAQGFQAFVLEYSVGKPFPHALKELAAFVAYLRENPVVFDVDPSQIFLCGFSAGGHLACSLGVFYCSKILKPFFPEENLIRPDGLILCYPVITSGEFTHRESMRNLMLSSENWEAVSLEKYVHDRMPRTFLWHTLDDELVLADNAFLLMRAMREHHVSFEAHIFPHGCHGLSLATEITAVSEEHINASVAQWFGLSVAWIRGNET